VTGDYLMVELWVPVEWHEVDGGVDTPEPQPCKRRDDWGRPDELCEHIWHPASASVTFDERTAVSWKARYCRFCDGVQMYYCGEWVDSNHFHGRVVAFIEKTYCCEHEWREFTERVGPSYGGYYGEFGVRRCARCNEVEVRSIATKWLPLSEFMERYA
jgi:hypothetical protein